MSGRFSQTSGDDKDGGFLADGEGDAVAGAGIELDDFAFHDFVFGGDDEP